MIVESSGPRAQETAKPTLICPLPVISVAATIRTVKEVSVFPCRVSLPLIALALAIAPSPTLAAGVGAITPVESHVLAAAAVSRGPMMSLAWLERTPDLAIVLRNTTITDGDEFDSDLLVTLSEHGFGSILYGLTLAISPTDGTRLIVYVEGDDQGTSLHAVTSAGTHTVIRETQHLIEFPAIEFDAAGRPFIAWSEQVGATSRVLLANQSEDGAWESRALSEDEAPYDLLPQVFSRQNLVEILWYSIAGSEVTAAQLLATQGFVGEASFVSLLGAPAHRLPTLFPVDGSSDLAALWSEPSSEGRDRFFVYYPDTVFAEGARPLIAEGGASVLSATAAQDGSGLIAWVEGNSAGTRTLVVGSPITLEEERVPVGPSAQEPLLAVSSGRYHLLWLEDAPSGFTRQLHFHSIDRNP